MNAAILTDTTKCIGCNECAIACKKVNHLARGCAAALGPEDGLSARNWTSDRGGPEALIRAQAMPALPRAGLRVGLPGGRLAKTEIGAVVYDSAKCMGCRYCMMACPYGIPRYDWDQRFPMYASASCATTASRPAATGLHRGMPDQGDDLRRPRRAAGRSPSPHRREAGRVHRTRSGANTRSGGTSVLSISNVDLSFLAPEHPAGSAPLPRDNRAGDARRAVRLYRRGGGDGGAELGHPAAHEAPGGRLR